MQLDLGTILGIPRRVAARNDILQIVILSEAKDPYDEAIEFAIS